MRNIFIIDINELKIISCSNAGKYDELSDMTVTTLSARHRDRTPTYTSDQTWVLLKGGLDWKTEWKTEWKKGM